MNQLTILHTNDTHSYLDDFGKRAFWIEEIKAENRSKGIPTLLLGSGDILSGSIYYNIYHGKKEAEFLNLLGYDALALGNHEFDGGSSGLSEYLEELTVPVLATNIDFSKDKLLSKFVAAGKIHPYLIKDDIGIFGLTTPSTVDSASPSDETIFKEPFAVAKETVELLRNRGCKTIVLISHLGDDVDLELAKVLPGLHVIVGGHTHRKLEKPLLENGVAIVQAGFYGKYLGDLSLVFSDETGQVEAATEHLHKIAEAKGVNPEIQRQIQQMQEEKDSIISQKIVESKREINGDKSKLENGKTSLGNLIADAYLWQAEERGYKPDLAIMNSGGIRTSLPAGTVTYGDIVKILPFSKCLTVLKATGAEIFEALRFGLYPQVSRMKLVYEDDELVTAKVLTDGVYQDLEAEKSYIVATNSFVGIGKDDYRGFRAAEVLEKDEVLDTTVLIDYLKQLKEPIDYPEGAEYENIRRTPRKN